MVDGEFRNFYKDFKYIELVNIIVLLYVVNIIYSVIVCNKYNI